MTVTRTTTDQGNHHLLFRIDNSPEILQRIKSACDQALNELTEILVSYESWNDPLSLSLFEWGANVIKFDSLSEIPNDFIMKVVERINHLRKEILINLFDNTPLKNPVLVNDRWVWEESVLQNYLKLSNLSPFDNQPIQKIIPHEFAKQYLTWLSKITSILHTDMAIPHAITNLHAVTMPLINISGISQQSVQGQLMTYSVLAQNVVLRQKMVSMRKEIESSTQAVILFREQMQILIQREKKIAEDRAKVHEQVLQDRIQNVENAHQTKVDLLNNRIDEGLQQLQDVRAQLNLTEEHCRSKDDKIQDILREEIQRAQQSSIHEQHIKKKIDKIESTHQDHMDLLNFQIKNEIQRHNMTRANLNQLEQTSRQQNQEILNLRYAYAQKATEVQQLQDEVNDSSCSVM